jgi:hypothetical protein
MQDFHSLFPDDSYILDSDGNLTVKIGNAGSSSQRPHNYQVHPTRLADRWVTIGVLSKIRRPCRTCKKSASSPQYSEREPYLASRQQQRMVNYENDTLKNALRLGSWLFKRLIIRMSIGCGTWGRHVVVR